MITILLLTITILIFFIIRSNETYAKKLSTFAGIFSGLITLNYAIIYHSYVNISAWIGLSLASLALIKNGYHHSFFSFPRKLCASIYLIVVGIIFCFIENLTHGLILANIYFFMITDSFPTLRVFYPIITPEVFFLTLLAFITSALYLLNYKRSVGKINIKRCLHSYIIIFWVLIVISQFLTIATYHSSLFASNSIEQCEKNDAAAVKKAQERIADNRTKLLEHIGNTEKSELHEAIENNDLEKVKELVEKGADMNKNSNIIFNSPVIFSIMHGKYDIFNYLIHNGGDLQQKVGSFSLLHYAAMARTNDVRFLKDLVNLGLDVSQYNANSTTFTTYTPLGVASRGMSISKDGELLNKTEIIDFLIDNGANVNEKNSISSPLYRAIISTNFEAMVHLIKRGADPMLKGVYYGSNKKRYTTLLSMALNMNDPRTEKGKKRLQKIIQYLQAYEKRMQSASKAI